MLLGNYRGRIAAAAALAGVLSPGAARAQATIRAGDSAFVRLGAMVQIRAESSEDAASGGTRNSLYLRRARLRVDGQVSPDVTFFIQTDDPNLGSTSPKNLATGFTLQDAMVSWKVSNALRLEAGLLRVPLSHEVLQTTTAFLSLDVSPTANAFGTPTQSVSARDTGFEARGYVLGRGQLEYRVMVSEGIRAPAAPGQDDGSRNSFRTTVFLNYNFFDTEDGYVLKGTDFGRSRILSLNAGWDRQASYNTYDVNVFCLLPTGKRDELGAELQWTHYDGQTWAPSLLRQNNALVQVAYLFAAAKTQPFAKYEAQKFSDPAWAEAHDVQRWGVGLNYYVSKQNLKLTAQVLRTVPDASTRVPSTNTFTVQLQVHDLY